MSTARCAAGRSPGLTGNNGARIFCRRLEAELLAIDGVYQTAEEMSTALRGKAVQALLDGEAHRCWLTLD